MLVTELPWLAFACLAFLAIMYPMVWRRRGGVWFPHATPPPPPCCARWGSSFRLLFSFPTPSPCLWGWFTSCGLPSHLVRGSGGAQIVVWRLWVGHRHRSDVHVRPAPFSHSYVYANASTRPDPVGGCGEVGLIERNRLHDRSSLLSFPWLCDDFLFSLQGIMFSLQILFAGQFIPVTAMKGWCVERGEPF